MKLPKVSIIIPVYNGANYLSNAIECALSQTYENLEVIVVNDGSTDDGATERIALSYGDRIRYFSKPNGGVSSALNYGIANMSGDYFSWLSPDDAYSPTKINDSVDLLRKQDVIGKKVIAFTGGYFIDSTGTKINNFKIYFLKDKLYSGQDVVNILTQKGTLNGCCMLIPREAFDDVGGFDETLRYSQDSLMWYQMFLFGYSLVSDNKLNVMYRLHRKQTSQLRRDLYEHDSLVIARMLVEPLAKVDRKHRTLLQYVKRLSKSNCNEAIDFICAYASKKRYFGQIDYLRIRIYRLLGFFRYIIVSKGKKLWMMIRN